MSFIKQKYVIHNTKMLHIWRKNITKNMPFIAQKICHQQHKNVTYMAKKYNTKYAINSTKMLHIWRKSITKNILFIL